jgi:TolB protein
MLDLIRLRRHRPHRIAILPVLAACLLAACASTARPAGPAGTAAIQATPDQTPTPAWGQAGPGWVLVMDSTAADIAAGANTRPAPTTLELVDPAGRQYVVHRWPAGTAAPELLAWSGDGTRALLVTQVPNQLPRSDRLQQLSLASGRVTAITLAGKAAAIGYDGPQDRYILGSRQAGAQVRIARYDLSGHLVKVLASGGLGDAAVPSPAGATLADGGPGGLVLISDSGGVIRSLPVPGTSPAGCSPDRWWTAGVILAGCQDRAAGRGQLWLVPADGARPSALTPPRGDHSADFGDIGAWSLPGGLYLQALGACGTVQIFRQAAGGSVTLVPVPHTTGDNNRILSALGSRLLVQAETGCPGSESLLWFSPVNGAEQWLIRTPAGKSGVIAAVPYASRENA